MQSVLRAVLFYGVLLGAIYGQTTCPSDCVRLLGVPTSYQTINPPHRPRSKWVILQTQRQEPTRTASCSGSPNTPRKKVPSNVLTGLKP